MSIILSIIRFALRYHFWVGLSSQNSPNEVTRPSQMEILPWALEGAYPDPTPPHATEGLRIRHIRSPSVMVELLPEGSGWALRRKLAAAHLKKLRPSPISLIKLQLALPIDLPPSNDPLRKISQGSLPWPNCPSHNRRITHPLVLFDKNPFLE